MGIEVSERDHVPNFAFVAPELDLTNFLVRRRPG